MSRRISGRATALLLLCAALLSFFVFPVGAVGGGESQPALAENQTVGSRFLELFFGEKKEQDGKSGDPEKEEIYLVPGGGIFGMRIYGCGVTVAGEAEENSGESLFRAGDRILSVGGIRVNSCEQVRREVAKSDGGEVVFEIGSSAKGERSRSRSRRKRPTKDFASAFFSGTRRQGSAR